MKSKDKEFIEKIKYSENKMAKKMQKEAKITKWIFYILVLLQTITYILIVVHLSNINSLIFYSTVYVIFVSYFSIRYAEYSRKILSEAIKNAICPEGFLNLSIDNAKRLIFYEKAYKYSLNNIAFAYIQLGELEEASKIIKYVESKNVDIILKSEIIQNKMDIAFYNDNIKKFKEECKNLSNIIKFLPRKYKKEALLNMNLKQAVIDKNVEEVNRICDQLEKNKILLNKVVSAYYRGVMLEKSNNKEYEKYYEFVAENGNNIIMANNAREKMKAEKKENIYKRKVHIVYKIFNILYIVVLITIIICLIRYTFGL